VLPIEEPLVAGYHDDSAVELSAILERREDLSHTAVHGAQHPEPIQDHLVRRPPRRAARIMEVHTAAQGVLAVGQRTNAGRASDRRAGIEVLISGCGRKRADAVWVDLGVDGFVCEEYNEGLRIRGLLDEFDGLSRENIGDVARLLKDLSVDVHLGVEVVTLSQETHPSIEPRPGAVILVAHVPLAKERRSVSAVVQEPWPGDEPMACLVAFAVVDDPVHMGILPREKPRSAG
jgi:hypothetical protein